MKRAFVWTSVISAVMLAALAIPPVYSAPDPDSPPAGSTERQAAAAVAPSPFVSAAPGDSGFDSQVNQWVQSLSQEAGFEAWKGARWDSYPLGPGTHGWLILVRSGGRDVGYLIIGDTEAGSYKLLEYGTGSKPLFGMTTLHRSLVQYGLIQENTSFDTFAADLFPAMQPKRLYAMPLQAVWQLSIGGETVWLDAKSGERLPELDEAFAADTSMQAEDDADAGSEQVTERLLTDPFDPFERPSWVKGKPIEAAPFQEIRDRLDQGDRLTFSGKWFGGKVIYPLAVTGYHVWTGELDYLGLDHEGTRYAPYQAAVRLGRLYR